MEYLSSILWFLAWPLVIIVSFKLVIFLLKKKKLIEN